MSLSASETFLHALAKRTFLKLWSLPNAHRAPGKELADLLVAFGDDVVLFSDKACDFSTDPDPATGWERWRREAIDGSVKQLGGALRRLSAADQRIFLDASGKAPLPFPLPPPERRRYHLVAIARPSVDPTAKPADWRPLTCVASTAGPFEVEPQSAGGLPVHVFDGEAVDLLLSQLDTAPDFISYLSGRAAALDAPGPYRFAERDLLAASIENWGDGDGFSPHVPPLTSVRPGAWQDYQTSGRAERSSSLNRKSRTIDALIEHFHRTFETGTYIHDRPPEMRDHEVALRMLAAESRFGRRIIATGLYDIISEDDQSLPWTATTPSPRDPTTRYLWMIYPDPPADTDPDKFARVVDAYLQHQILVTAGDFRPDKVVGIALPNQRGSENVVIMKVFDSSRWTDEDRRQAKLLKENGLFGEPERVDYLHSP